MRAAIAALVTMTLAAAAVAWGVRAPGAPLPPPAGSAIGAGARLGGPTSSARGAVALGSGAHGSGAAGAEGSSAPAVAAIPAAPEPTRNAGTGGTEGRPEPAGSGSSAYSMDEVINGTQDEREPRRRDLADGAIEVNFAYLASYTLELRGPLKHRVPPEIAALSGKVVQLEGYIMPLESEGDEMKRWLLVRHLNNCCFGRPIQINEIIEIVLPEGGRTPYLPDTVAVRGTLEVGLNLDEHGDPLFVYRLRPDKVFVVR